MAEGRFVPDGLSTIPKYDHGHDTEGARELPGLCLILDFPGRSRITAYTANQLLLTSGKHKQQYADHG